MRVSAAHRLRERTFLSNCISAHTRPDEAAPGTPIADDLLLASSCQRQHTSENLAFKPRRSHAPNFGRDVLALVFPDGALSRRSVTRRILCAAGSADECRHKFISRSSYL